MRFVLVAALSFACTTARDPAPPPADEPPPPDVAPSQSLTNAMHVNLAGTSVMHEAVQRGDLVGAKSAAKAVATAPRIEGLPETWLDLQVAMRLEAAKFQEVETLEDAAKGNVALAGKCAACHEFLALGPKFFEKAPIVDRGTLPSQMAVHAWGADLMWKGLVAPDPTVYAKGAAAIAETFPAFPTDPGNDPELGWLGQRVPEIGAQAVAATGPEERGAAYAALLGTCASCHQKVKVEPQIPWGPPPPTEAPPAEGTPSPPP